MNTKETPILLLTGYLGSGKTTLVNHILSNQRGIKFAVIVNDIGEVNIDADLIQKGGIVGKKDESLVALQNGCICCTLRADLIEQIFEIMKMQRFDYIVIEASGICEPEPIAQTICSIPRLGENYTKYGRCRLDCVTTVVDALRLESEFACGDQLTREHIDEEDIENLIIQQIEFCNLILLNKASEVKPEELARIKQILRTLQPAAKIIECDYAKVALDDLIDTRLFNFERVATSAGWIRGIEKAPTEEEEEEAHHHHHEHHHHDEDDDHDDHDEHEHDEHEHGHQHHHHHDHEEGEAEEYGIGTFVYYSRKPFDLGLFDDFVARKWPRDVVRAKGICYFADERDMCYVFEQAGRQKTVKQAGQWIATMPKDQLDELLAREEQLRKEWDDKVGDRMIKIVFIGQHLQKEAICKELDKCLVD